MPNRKSAEKRLKTDAKRRSLNRLRKSRVRAARKEVVTCLDGGDVAGAREALKKCFSVLDKAAKAGAIHGNQADRVKARLTARIAASQ